MPNASAPPTFRFMGHDLTPIPVYLVCSRACLFLALAVLATGLGLRLSGPGVAGGFLVSCMLSAGLPGTTWRGALAIAAVLLVAIPMFVGVAALLAPP